MTRSNTNTNTFALAALTLAAAAGIAWWQVSRSDDRPQAAPARLAHGSAMPHVTKSTRVSPYRKLTDTSIRWQERVDLLRQMNASKLTPEDIDILYALLRHQPAAGQAENWWVVVNEIMEQMRLHAIAPDRYGNEMLAILHDASAPEVLRDCAVQHLGQWVSPRGAALGQPSEQNPAIIRETADTFASLIVDPAIAHTTIPGTSLMVLIDMQGGGVAQEIMAPVFESLNPWLATTIAGENETSKITRISAINAIGMLQLESFRPAIRALATTETQDPSLRLNSIAALGQIGEPSDIATLQSIAANDKRLRYAARAALSKLTASPQ